MAHLVDASRTTSLEASLITSIVSHLFQSKRQDNCLFDLAFGVEYLVIILLLYWWIHDLSIRFHDLAFDRVKVLICLVVILLVDGLHI